MDTREKLSWRGGAVFDPTGKYRYTLWRVWQADSARVVFIMLNPSTADAQKNDPTIARCVEFAYTWKFGSLEVVNLFAYRTPNPCELSKVDNPIGTENDSYLMQAITRSSCVVVAWGTKGTLLGRDHQVLQFLVHWPHVNCLGYTQDGYPRHPLYLRRDTPLMPFR